MACMSEEKDCCASGRTKKAACYDILTHRQHKSARRRVCDMNYIIGLMCETVPISLPTAHYTITPLYINGTDTFIITAA